MRRWRVLSAVTALVVGLSTAAVAQDRSDLSAVRERVREISQELEAARGRAEDANAALADADARLAEIEAVVNDLSRRLEQQAARVEQAEEQLQRYRDEMQAVRAAFEARTVQLFKTSFGSDLEIVLSAGDIRTAIDRQVLLRAVNRSDRATMEQVDAAQARVETQQEILTREAERLETMRAEQAVILEEVRALRETRALAAANARAEVVELAHRKEDLEADQARIERLIQQRTAPPPTISSPSVGGYIWPLCGRVTSEYGRRWGRLHAGLDIDDNLSRAIVAAKSGVVAFAGWSGGYGQLTLIDHGDGVVTAYAHQSSILVAEGQSVSRGQRIGTVGTTGSSTGTHLHFETRVNGSAVNPRRFLPGGC